MPSAAKRFRSMRSPAKNRLMRGQTPLGGSGSVTKSAGSTGAALQQREPSSSRQYVTSAMVDRLTKGCDQQQEL